MSDASVINLDRVRAARRAAQGEAQRLARGRRSLLVFSEDSVPSHELDGQPLTPLAAAVCDFVVEGGSLGDVLRMIREFEVALETPHVAS